MEAEQPDAGEFVTVARVDEIPDDCGVAFPLGRYTVAVFREGDEFFAINDFCPHMGASLAPGSYCGGAVMCPWHAWRFDVRTGAWLDSPRVKTDSFEVRVVDGMIQVFSQPRRDPKD